MKIKITLDKGAYKPQKAHPTDAGFDIFTPVEVTVKANSHAFIDTGVHIAIPDHFVGMIKSKSGLNCKHDLTAEGVIDAGYTGSIGVKVYNHGAEDYTFKAGDKLTQLVILPVPALTNDNLVLVDNLEDTERGDGGFGSTGR